MRKNSSERFFQLLKKGEVRPDDLDNYVDEWHDEKDCKMELWDYLGVTENQYMRFLGDRFKSLDRFYGID